MTKKAKGAMVNLRRCTRCKLSKPVTEFHKWGKKAGEQKYRPDCKACRCRSERERDAREREVLEVPIEAHQ